MADARPAALEAAGGAKAAPSQDLPGALVGCATTGPTGLTLALAPPGAPLGSLALFPLADPPARGAAPLLGPPGAVLAGAHTDAARCWAWLGDGASSTGPLAAATGGEDGVVALWGVPGAAGGVAPHTPAPLPMGANSPGNAQAKKAQGGLKKGSVRRRSTPSG